MLDFTYLMFKKKFSDSS